jgi:hypothetical protein
MATSVSLRKSFALAPRKLARYSKIGLVLPETQHCMTSDSRRLAILTAREINELYGLPCFTDQERCIYFDLSPAEHDAVDAVHTDAAAVHMVLQLGYFKAKRQFFNFYRFGALGIFYPVRIQTFAENRKMPNSSAT